ncbi:MAG: SH3 domain-containing protein [Anaerolineaceae bacterium]|jgi:hypothetical protein
MKKKMACSIQAAAVFSQPSPGSARVGQLWRDQEVIAVEESEGWVKIRQPEGWVPVEHLEERQPASDAASGS